LTARARQPIRPFGRIVCSARFVELAGDFDGIASQHELGRLDEGLLLRRPDLPLDDSDGELLPAQQPGDAVPNGRGALAWIRGLGSLASWPSLG
jgi:hypothetical protein